MARKDKTMQFVNFYQCPCGAAWEDIWDSACNDHCPDCDSEVEPYESKEEPNMTCPLCAGPMWLLEALGRLRHFRCHDCGAQTCREANKED